MSQQMARNWEQAIAEHPEDWHMLHRSSSAISILTASAELACRRRRRMIREDRDGLPVLLDVPGGVQQHVRDLAEALIDYGHEVSVISPADDDTPLPPYVVGAGRAVPVPYNGSVARLSFGFVSASRVRRWVKEGGFDLLHVHEPGIPRFYTGFLAFRGAWPVRASKGIKQSCCLGESTRASGPRNLMKMGLAQTPFVESAIPQGTCRTMRQGFGRSITCPCGASQTPHNWNLRQPRQSCSDPAALARSYGKAPDFEEQVRATSPRHL